MTENQFICPNCSTAFQSAMDNGVSPIEVENKIRRGEDYTVLLKNKPVFKDWKEKIMTLLSFAAYLSETNQV